MEQNTEEVLEISPEWETRSKHDGFFDEGFPFDIGYPQNPNERKVYELITRNGSRRLAFMYTDMLWEPGDGRWRPLDGGRIIGPQVVVAWREITLAEYINANAIVDLALKYKQAASIVVSHGKHGYGEVQGMLGLPKTRQIYELVQNYRLPEDSPEMALLRILASSFRYPIKLNIAAAIHLENLPDGVVMFDLSNLEPIITQIDALCPACKGNEGDSRCPHCRGEGIRNL